MKLPEYRLVNCMTSAGSVLPLNIKFSRNEEGHSNFINDRIGISRRKLLIVHVIACSIVLESEI